MTSTIISIQLQLEIQLSATGYKGWDCERLMGSLVNDQRLAVKGGTIDILSSSERFPKH